MELLIYFLKWSWGIMIAFILLDENKLKIQMQKKTSGLEKENQDLRTEILELKQEKHRISPYTKVLEEIKRIFTNVIKVEMGTECKVIEAELSHQREMLQQIFDNIPILLVIWDPRLEKFTLNRYSEQVLGWTTAEANNGDFMANVYPDPAYRAEASDYMLSLKTGWREWMATSKNGQYVPIEWANVFLSDDTMIGIGIDLSERKKAEAKLKETLDNLENLVKERTVELERAYDSLKESEKSLTEAQKMAHMGNWDWNIVAGTIHWSEELFYIFGLNPQESGLRYNEFLNYVHADDRDYVDNAIKKALKGKPYNIDFRITSADGKEIIIHSEGEVIFSEKNTPIRMRAIAQDITEHKKAKEKILNLANIVESSNEAIITKSFDGIITSWNKGAEYIYGYSAEEILEKPISILEPPTLAGETERLCDMVKQGEKIQQYETLRLRKDGKTINVSLNLSPVFDNQGKITSVSIIAINITRRKEAEEALAKIQQTRIKEIHHRIKNNLQVISSLLDLQAEKFSHLETCKAP